MKSKGYFRSLCIAVIGINILSFVILPIGVYCEETTGEIRTEILCSLNPLNSDPQKEQSQASGQDGEHCNNCNDVQIQFHSIVKKIITAEKYSEINKTFLQFLDNRIYVHDSTILSSPLYPLIQKGSNTILNKIGQLLC